MNASHEGVVTIKLVNDANPSVTYMQPGTYDVSLTALLIMLDRTP